VSYIGIPNDGLVISQTKFGRRSFFADHWPDRACNYLPCVDHVSDKAAVEFIVTAPEHYTVVSNGSLVEEKDLIAGMKTTHWREDVPLPVKVMTFGAADFAVEQSGTAAGIPVWTYVYPENSKEGFSDYALALKAVNFYSELVGPYSFPKLANVQSKTMFGGLENAGCIFYSENSVTGTGRSEGLIAHEIAHQWFGNSVTEADWYHIWLSEGFATYLTSMYWEKEQGNERLKSDMKSARDRVLRTSVSAPKPVIDTTIIDLMRLISANSYQKGAWVLHMLRNQIGDSMFRDGLRLYYSRYRNSNALTDDFRKVMEEASGQDLRWFFNQWLYVGGQPDLRTEWSWDSNTGVVEVTVSQTQENLFRFPLDLEIVTGAGQQLFTIECIDKVTNLRVSSTEKPSSVVTDPGVLLLFRTINP
jgi:aminopeptidase N